MRPIAVVPYSQQSLGVPFLFQIHGISDSSSDTNSNVSCGHLSRGRSDDIFAVGSGENFQPENPLFWHCHRPALQVSRRSPIVRRRLLVLNGALWLPAIELTSADNSRAKIQLTHSNRWPNKYRSAPFETRSTCKNVRSLCCVWDY